MAATVEFLFDFGSPASYIAHRRLPALVARTGVIIDYQPVLLGGIFKSSGNSAPATVPAKGRYLFRDLQRFADRERIPLAMNPYFPPNTVLLMRIATGLVGTLDFMTFVDAAFDAMWIDARDMSGRDSVAAVLDRAGLDAETMLALAQDGAVKERMRANTDAAVARGVFGVPTFFVDGEMFFGQDRLDWVEAALTP